MILRPLTLLGIVVSMVTGVALGITGYHHWYGSLPAEEQYLDAFEEVLRQVHDGYVDDVTQEQLLTNALRGMIGSLDNHSTYLDSTDYDDLHAQTSGMFGGIGIELGLVDDYFTVIAPIDDTPAATAGLRAGDRLIALDDEPLSGKRLIHVVGKLRGKPNTPITLSVKREDLADAFDVKLHRAVITTKSVKSRLLEPGYGYIRVSQFQSRTGNDFVTALKKLKRKAGGELSGLILDLRNNPGGVLQASVTVADAFLTEGLIVYTQGRLPSSHLKYRAAGGDELNGAPLVVLINAGSASASEIVAGALQDHDRATVMGAKSYGKGSVQSLMQLNDQHAIKLTTALYYTPSGRSIHDRGVEPDIPFTLETDDPQHYEDELLTSALNQIKTQTKIREQANDDDSLHAKL